MSRQQHLLASVPLFASLPQHELHNLASTLRTMTVRAGTILIREGDVGDNFYIVIGGQVEVVKALGTADERLIGVRGPGEFFGEMGLLNAEGMRTASVRARQPAWVWEMTRADFDQLLHRQPMLAYEMVRVLSSRLNASHNRAIQDLHEKNRQLTQAYEALKAAQAQIIEKERLDRELKVAHEIQMSILPRTLPRLPGFEFSAVTVPARSVGGDFYDLIPLGGDAMGIVIGDVTDKGVPAAIFMAQAHALLRAEADPTVRPHAVLERVNGHLLEMNEANLLVTVLYGVLNEGSGEFTYARAGHEPPLLCPPDGQVAFAPLGHGHSLGAQPDPMLDEQTVSIPPGGLLLLYTDGITDARNPQGVFFGEDRVIAALRENAGASPQVVCDRLLQRVMEHHGASPQYDDITLVVVRSAG